MKTKLLIICLPLFAILPGCSIDDDVLFEFVMKIFILFIIIGFILLAEFLIGVRHFFYQDQKDDRVYDVLCSIAAILLAIFILLYFKL